MRCKDDIGGKVQPLAIQDDVPTIPGMWRCRSRWRGGALAATVSGTDWAADGAALLASARLCVELREDVMPGEGGGGDAGGGGGVGG